MRAPLEVLAYPDWEPRAMRVPRGPGLYARLDAEPLAGERLEVLAYPYRSRKGPNAASASRAWPWRNELKEPGQAGAGGASPTGASSIPAIDACFGDEVFQSDRVSGEMAAIGALSPFPLYFGIGS